MADQHEGNPDYYIRCPDGRAHEWTYRGKASQMYSCARCAVVVAKSKLQEVSNAQLHN